MFGFDSRWTEGELEQAETIFSRWQVSPVNPGELLRLYFCLEFCVRYKPFTKYALYMRAYDLRVGLMDLCCKVFPAEWVKLSLSGATSKAASRGRVKTGQ